MLRPAESPPGCPHAIHSLTPDEEIHGGLEHFSTSASQTGSLRPTEVRGGDAKGEEVGVGRDVVNVDR